MIATSGYHYDPHRRSPVAFFPLFPWLGAAVIQLTGLGPTSALLLVSHVCLATAFVLASTYLRDSRFTVKPTASSLTLLALGLMPATLFFRITYSESTFLLVNLVFLLGIQRRWQVFVVAAIAGLATSARPAGIGLLVPLLLYVWYGSPSRAAFLVRAPLAAVLGCWGLLAYATFLYARFGDPLAFAKTQIHWGSPGPSQEAKILSLLSYEPIWQVFLRGPDGNWSMFTWELVNPLYFVATVVLVLFGIWRGWLNGYEGALAGMLLIIPYLTRAHEMNMASSARFAAVVFPLYLVVGNGLARLPPIVSGALLAISAFFLGAFSALFVSGHLVF
jgi:hypothetical protein